MRLRIESMIKALKSHYYSVAYIGLIVEKVVHSVFIAIKFQYCYAFMLCQDGGMGTWHKVVKSVCDFFF